MASPIQKDEVIIHEKQVVEGINLLGYARAEMGVGESCRLAANSLNAVGVPFGIINFTGISNSRLSDLTWAHKEISVPSYSVNVFHINAEQMPEINLLYGNSLFENRYNIGYWHWELPDFPDEWQNSFKYVDEIWVPSTFVGDAISIKSPVPVIKIPHSIEVKIMEQRNRAYYKLPEKAFLFLTMFDVKSFSERKNPKASIDAFKLAFGPNDMNVGLVVKVNRFKSNFNGLDMLTELISNYKNIYLIDETISRNDVNALINVTDCFISLHRSEGFGLGFAEAMYLGKPVIGTNWSSNTDFMNEKNACLVDYKLVQLEKDYGPYKSYQYWADPSVQHASEYMIKLISNKEYYNMISSEGESHIKSLHSPIVIGQLIRKRLDYIFKWKFGG
ncbi:glycosyltransferase [Paenibacillus sp. FSL H8-0034]|uniref:glycosyltransferase n=1 Tax=Paenibacillus sp. FSL H8-0034 TaxID=2954671 RepID=UPI0030F6784B